tara:strand:- start:1768 stop:2379 length:612 start_codon:yes stop_codon:yes gene_type:complete
MPEASHMNPSRRKFLGQVATGLLVTAISPISIASVARLPATPRVTPGRDWRQVLLNRDRWLSLEREATGEKGAFKYFEYGKGFDSRGYAAACHLLRDVASNRMVQMDKRLIDLLYLIQSWCRINRKPYVITIMSGYRTPAYNATVAGAVRNSEHTKGTAADIRISGLSTQDLGLLARQIGVGGVGFYTGRGFIHIDVGRVRQW